MPRDPYEVLGVAREADESEIKSAFRRVARELHPDVNDEPDAEERFKECAEAYEILSDPERRQVYDRYGHEGLRSSGWAPHFDQFGSLSDLFESFFGGGGGIFGVRHGPAPGGDVAAAVEINLADAATGTSVDVSFEAVERCPRCHGNKAEPGTPIETCERCGGAGRLQAVSRTPFGQMVRTAECDVCGGEGKRPKQPCAECRGRGRRLSTRKLSVDIPAGIADGQRIRLSGRGDEGEAGAPPGDLYILVRVKEDARFLRDGDDLITVLDVAAPLAALGATLEVPTLDGPEEVEVPAGSQPGEIIVLDGRGMPSLRAPGALGRTRRAGDLRVVLNVVIPRRLSREQRALVKELAESLSDENLNSDESLIDKLKRAIRAPS
jgi:molecular chaperone DnaJ